MAVPIPPHDLRPKTGAPRMGDGVVAVVMGREVFKEVERSPDGAVLSVRYWTTCPLEYHGLKHARSRKRRNSGPRQTAQLGEIEPVAFLGAWLAQAHKFVDREDHIKYRPSDKHVRKFVSEHGLPQFGPAV